MRLAASLGPWLFLLAGVASAQVPVPVVPGQVPVPDPIVVPGPAPVQGPGPVQGPTLPAVPVPDPVTIPAPVPNPIGNPIGTPIGNPIGNPVGNPIGNVIGNPIGNPLQTPDVTQGPGGLPGQPQGRQVGANQGSNQAGQKIRVYIGTYTGAKTKGEGIYRSDLDLAAGTMTPPVLAAKASNPSFLAVHPTGRFLYSVNEDGPGGMVSAFALDPKSGNLAPLNAVDSKGSYPCYVTVDPVGSAVLVANYGSGTVAVLPIGPDGGLRPASDVVQHKGSGPNKQRQEGPHAHSIDVDPTGRLAVAADLGLDDLIVYDFDVTAGKLRLHIPPTAERAPGSGPRHVAFAPDGRHAYVISEMASTITLFDFDRSRGSFAPLQAVSTRADGAKGPSSTAEIAVHPSGRFVYGSNRGDDTIAIFAVEAASGKLTPVGSQPTGGKTPRFFAIDPTGQFLLAGNQDSNTITLFRVDPATGRLTPTGDPVACPAPVCFRFLPSGQ